MTKKEIREKTIKQVQQCREEAKINNAINNIHVSARYIEKAKAIIIFAYYDLEVIKKEEFEKIYNGLYESFVCLEELTEHEKKEIERRLKAREDRKSEVIEND